MDKRIFLIEKYICENLQKELTIEDLANQTKLSAAHFTKFFKDHFGTSPKHYIKNVRLEEACKLLESEEILQINEIALAVGFKDSAYFIRSIYRKIRHSTEKIRIAKMG